MSIERHVLPPDVARAIRARRAECGYSMRAAARALGMNHGFLSAIETGTRAPSGRYAEPLVVLLGLDGDVRRAVLEVADAVDEGRRARAAAREGWGQH